MATGDRLPTLHTVRQAALMTLALRSTRERIGDDAADRQAREVWGAALASRQAADAGGNATMMTAATVLAIDGARDHGQAGAPTGAATPRPTRAPDPPPPPKSA